MQLVFGIPNQLQLRGLTKPWEAAVTGADQTRLAQWADTLGYAMISVPEHHVMPVAQMDRTAPHHFSAIPAMAHFSGATRNIRLNSSVAILPLHNPIVLAKAFSTMDWLSSGRITANFGVGWMEAEFEALGIPFAERGARCDEYISAMVELWTKERPEFEGQFVSFRDIAFEPKCVQTPHVPIWFGGDANPMLRRVARHGTGWWPFLTQPEDLPARLDYIRSQPDYSGNLREVCLALTTGRINADHTINLEIESLFHSKQAIIDHLSRFAELGVTISSVPAPGVDSLQAYFDHTQWVAEEIMPAIA
jgi:probable F420-dependent oxidoreductase